MVRLVRAKVYPGSKRQSVELDGDTYHIRVTVAPEKGAATRAAAALLAKSLGVPRSKIKLKVGRRSRIKLFKIET